MLTSDSLQNTDPWQVVWGRGAIDDKHSVLGILQALDIILGRGERPSRTFYIGTKLSQDKKDFLKQKHFLKKKECRLCNQSKLIHYFLY